MIGMGPLSAEVTGLEMIGFGQRFSAEWGPLCLGQVTEGMMSSHRCVNYWSVALQVTTHQSYDEKCDIFALGCLMYDLYTRQLRHVNLFANIPLGANDADVLGLYAIKV